MDLNVEEVNTGRVEVVEVGVDATVSDLKNAARAAFRIASEVELRVQGKLLEKETESLSAFEVEAGSTFAVHEANGYGYSITTSEHHGENSHTDHFNDLSLQTARLYAIHLRSFRALPNNEVAATREELERSVGENYDEKVMRALVRTWFDNFMWRTLDSVRLTFTPSASKPTTLDWNSFVVSVPGLLRARGGKRRREGSAPETSAVAFCLSVHTDEGDADNGQIDTHDRLTLTQARLYASILAYCSSYGNEDRSLGDEEETAAIEKICTALDIDGYDDDARRINLMRTLFGTWNDGETWRNVRGVTLTRIANPDLIRDVDYDAFEDQAFQLDQMAQQAETTDADED